MEFGCKHVNITGFALGLYFVDHLVAEGVYCHNEFIIGKQGRITVLLATVLGILYSQLGKRKDHHLVLK